jgi:hypothetical protein
MASRQSRNYLITTRLFWNMSAVPGVPHQAFASSHESSASGVRNGVGNDTALGPVRPVSRQFLVQPACSGLLPGASFLPLRCRSFQGKRPCILAAAS